MASVNLYWQNGVDLTSIQTTYGVIAYAGPTQIVVQAGSYQAVYDGNGFTYDTISGMITGGVLTDFNESINGMSVFAASNLNLSATTVAYYVQSNQDAALLSLALAGDDSIVGSPGNDIINAFGGTNYVNGQGGFNTEIFSGDASQYNMARTSQGLLVAGVGATDTLVSIQRLVFADRTISVAPDSPISAQAAFALYNSDASTRFIQIADSATDVAAVLSALETPVSQGAISSIALTDGGTPTITLSATFQLVYRNVLSLITTPYILATVPCFAAGTRILTECGLVQVQDLEIGQCLRTSDGLVQPIVWLGHRHVVCDRHPNPKDVWPVRVHAHALGDNRPVRDLLLSPDHALLIDASLIPVRYLVNGATIVQESQANVEYWHVELPRHAVLYAEGVETESYLDTGNRSAFANGGGTIQLHPDFALNTWATAACAPLVRSGPMLAAARRVLLARAGALGFLLARRADLHLVVDGVPVWPSLIQGSIYRFRLPIAASTMRIVSNAANPAEVTANATDARRLGVMIETIAAFSPWEWRTLKLSDVAKGRGFHAVESDGAREWCWSDGDAELRLPVDLAERGMLLLDLDIGDVQPAWMKPAIYVTIKEGEVVPIGRTV